MYERAVRAWARAEAMLEMYGEYLEQQTAEVMSTEFGELRTSFVSLMSHSGVSIEEIARLVGHASTRTTEIVYRRELRPVITTGAEIMDQLFTAT